MMRATLRFLMRAFLAAASIAALLIGSAWYLLVASIPDYSEDFGVSGLHATVEILRDASAVPHISGSSEDDIYFALGFVHAQDRLGQLLRLRRASAGLGTQSQQAALPVEVEAALVAYSNGINAWIGEISKGGLGRGAPELLLSRSSIATWTPTDSLAIAENFLIGLQENTTAPVWRDEVRRQIPISRPDLPEFYDASFGPYLQAWGVPAARTVSGHPIILADIAGPLSLPSQWYLADLRLPNGSVIGATLPGLPMVIVGRSDKLVWGVQSVGLAATPTLVANEVGAPGDLLSALARLMKADDAVQAILRLDEISTPPLGFVIADRENLLEWPTTQRQS